MRPAGTTSLTGTIVAITTGRFTIVLIGPGPESLSMQPDKAHLSQSNGIGACFFGQQGMPSVICMTSSPVAGIVAVATSVEAAAAITGAAGPITTPTEIPSAKSQRMTAGSFMATKSHRRCGLRSPMTPISDAVDGRLHHALVSVFQESPN